MINCDLSQTIVFSVKGNYTDRLYRFYPVEVLYEAYKNQVGNKIYFENYGNRIISNVYIQGDYVFIETV